ncbi:MAG: hypothetical protein IPI59_15645 [Sphingobacteriales bacterium]|jgi:hypothetical protein|nr:hypothetical protein [Sphingobacteriales bacterium]MCC7058000.1 hypothetical protein [Chitinophagales bacterium]MDA0199680.1 DUF6046 domain-containing protein [Bacteroidota bacterium]MBK6888562.1 hypothetical protein [Sphingobacteriales bacterium]MBK7528930.1 hypothetical protein [Sphingobacteriales bacterium]
MAYNFNIETLLRQNFGINPQNYPDIVTMKKVVGNKNSLLGTPIIMPVVIPPFTYINGQKNNTKFEGMTFPAATMVEVNLEKTIIKTPLSGYTGTAKELFSCSDFSVTIKGVCCNYSNPEYPEEEVRLLKRLFDIPAAVPIENELLNLLDINFIAIDSLEFPATEGYQNIQNYLLQATSDTPFELTLNL